MSECDDGVDKTALPDERAHPQPIEGENVQHPATRSASLSGDGADTGGMKHQRAGARRHTTVLDDARFTAGIISLYEAVLSEPIPEKMLRLIEEIGKQERKF